MIHYFYFHYFFKKNLSLFEHYDKGYAMQNEANIKKYKSDKNSNYSETYMSDE